MMRFVENPNLPENCGTVIIGEKYADILQKPLSKLGIEVIKSPENRSISKPVAYHADMSVTHGGGERLYVSPACSDTAFIEKLRDLSADVVVSDKIQSPQYPDDVSMNICCIGDYVISSDYSDESIVDYLTIDRINLKVRQGYCKCSIAVVDNNSIITSDRGIASVASKAGLNTLLISPGHIVLEGYDYGFIGGSCFKISKNLMAFTGTINNHPDAEKILKFLSEHEITPVFLTDKEIFDIGGAIPITEK